MFSGRSPQFIQYWVNSLISYAFSVKPSKRSVWKMCLYMYICVALYLLINKLLSYPILSYDVSHRTDNVSCSVLDGMKICKTKTIFNTLRPRQNGRYFADDIFKCIFLNGNACISLKISLKFVPKVRIDNIQALVQIMAWRRPGDKPLSEPMMVSLLTHICVTRPQWVKYPGIPGAGTEP